MRFRILFTLFLLNFPVVYAQNDTYAEADSLAAVGKQQEAIAILQDIENKADKVYLKLAKLQQEKGKIEDAIKNYQVVLKRDPKRIVTAMNYGELLLDNNRFQEAEIVFQELSEEFPENAAFTYRLGLVMEKQKDSTATALFFKTVNLDSTHQGALYKTAKFQLQERNPHAAIVLSKKGLETRPNNISLLSILGQAYMATLQFEKAIEPLQKIIDLGEGSEFILEKLGKAYRSTGRTKDAIATYKLMLDINDANSAVHSNLGVLYMQLDEMDKAQQHFTMALLIKKQPVDREYVNIGLTFKNQENYQEAYRNFKMALEENPDNQRALIELAIAGDAHFKDKKLALTLYEDFVKKYAENGRKDMLSLAEYRISELKREIHQSK